MRHELFSTIDDSLVTPHGRSSSNAIAASGLLRLQKFDRKLRPGYFSRQFLGHHMNFPHLFSPLQVGPYRLGHRVVMAPLTRMRAERLSFVPRPLNAEYYGQRATPGGLLIAEATPVTMAGRGNPGVPGIYSQAQIEGWRAVVDAVHAKGGLIFLQLWHVGRVSHSSHQPRGARPVAPSAVRITNEGML